MPIELSKPHFKLPDGEPLEKILSASEATAFTGYNPYPTDYELAQFSKLVYDTKTAGECNLPEGWILLTKASDTSNDYYGAAYYHPHRRQLVIAHRGTYYDNLGSWQADLDLASHKITTQQISAAEFLKEVLKQVPNSVQLSCVGHSLGGWLAQVTAYHAEEQGFHPHTVVLDSPGASNVLKALLPNVQAGIPLENLDITTYVTAPDRVNTCNSHLGKVYKLFLDLPPSEERQRFWQRLYGKIQDYFSYTLLMHSSDLIANQFDKATGQPKKAMAVVSWPEVKWEPKPSSGRGVSSIGSLLSDWWENADLSQYSEFFKYATRMNEYHPTPDNLSFQEGYFLTHQAKYQTAVVDPSKTIANVFNRRELSFLCKYQLVRDLFKGNPPGLDELFQRYQLSQAKQIFTNYQLTGDSSCAMAGWQIQAHDVNKLIRYVKGVSVLIPDFTERFEAYVNTIMPTLTDKVAQVERANAASREEIAEMKQVMAFMQKPAGPTMSLIGKNARVGKATITNLRQVDDYYLEVPPGTAVDPSIAALLERTRTPSSSGPVFATVEGQVNELEMPNPMQMRRFIKIVAQEQSQEQKKTLTEPSLM
jgi:pimeloyl-ACP methyl ester carboxylesterase